MYVVVTSSANEQQQQTALPLNSFREFHLHLFKTAHMFVGCFKKDMELRGSHVER